MKTICVIDNNLNKIVQSMPLLVEEPCQTLFCKDRKTKQRYIMIKTIGSDPFDISKRQLMTTNYCQYDNVSIGIK